MVKRCFGFRVVVSIQAIYTGFDKVNNGLDHAGISTQSVVKNTLWRQEKKTRHDLGRKKFVETVWEWKEEYSQKIYEIPVQDLSRNLFF